MKLNDLKEKRAAKIAEMRTMNDNRDLDDGERTKFTALETETRTLEEQIGRAADGPFTRLKAVLHERGGAFERTGDG